MSKEKKEKNVADPLEELYVDKSEVDRQLLSDVLKSYLGIDKETLEPVFKKGYQELTNKDKVLAYLLYRRSLAALGQINEKEVAQGPQEIADETGVNYNSVRSALSNLGQDNVIAQENEGGYYVSPHAISFIADRFSGES